MLEYNRQSAPAYYIRAEAFRLQHKHAAALDDLRYCLAIDSANAQAHHAAGLCLAELGEHVKAATHLTLALKNQRRPQVQTIVCRGRRYQS